MNTITEYELPTEFFDKSFSLSESDFRNAVPGDPCRCVFAVGVDTLISTLLPTRRGRGGVLQFDINVSDRGCVSIVQTLDWDSLVRLDVERKSIFYYARLTPVPEARELIQLFDSDHPCSYHEYQNCRAVALFKRFEYVKWKLERLPEPCTCCFMNYEGQTT